MAEARPGVRILATARGIAKQNAYFLGNRDFTLAHPEIITAVREELAKVAQWTEVNRDAVAQILADATGIDIAAWKRAVQRTDYRVAPLNEAIIEKQQRVTDRFHRLGLIPNPYGQKSGLAVEPSGRLAMVVAQETVLSPATSFTGPSRCCAARGEQQDVTFPLVVPLAMAIVDVLAQRPPQRPLAEQDHPVQAPLLDRPDPALLVGIQVRAVRRQCKRYEGARRQNCHANDLRGRLMDRMLMLVAPWSPPPSTPTIDRIGPAAPPR